MTNEEICHLYDSNPNMTLARLSEITGLTVSELKKILLRGKPTK